MVHRRRPLVSAATGAFVLLGLLSCQEGAGTNPVVDEAADDSGDVAASEPGSSDYQLHSIVTPGGGFGRAHGINDSSVVVGTAVIDGGLRAFRWSDGTFEELEGLGGAMSGAYAINDEGVIVGEAENAEGHLRAVAWIDGTAVDLGTLGGTTSQALAVNEQGRVVGRAQDAEGVFRPFLWHGEMEELPLPPGEKAYASAEGINDAGRVVGTAEGSDGQQALLWSGDDVTVLETTCSTATASDINGEGRIVGSGSGCEISPAVGVPLLWNGDRTARHLEPLGGLKWPLSSPTLQNGGEAHSINARGEIAGWSTLQPDDVEAIRSTLWYRDSVVNLGGEPGSGQLRFTGAADINDRGVAVGVSAETPVLFLAEPHREMLADRIPAGLDSRVPEKEAGSPGADALFGIREREGWASELCGGSERLRGPGTVGEILAGCPSARSK